MSEEQKATPSKPVHMPGWTAHTYRQVGDVTLDLWVNAPLGDPPSSSPRPAVLFFYGGGWNGGTTEQFRVHGEYLASLGMVAVLVEYRVKSRHGTAPEDCVSDAFAAMRMVRGSAKAWGIDPDRIAAAGGSAGGHLAACTALLPEAPPLPGDTVQQADVRPNALVLFNPGLVIGPVPPQDDEFIDVADFKPGRFAANASPDISPYRHLNRHPNMSLPRTLILHGDADTTTPIAGIHAFAAKATARGQHCDVAVYPGMGHGFFNLRAGAGKADNFIDTLTRTVTFFHKLDWLPIPGDRAAITQLAKNQD